MMSLFSSSKPDSTEYSLRTTNVGGASCPLGVQGKSTECALLHKTLFSLPKTGSMASHFPNSESSCFGGAFPVDGCHILVVGVSSGANESTSVFHVVRHAPEGKKTCGRVCLPIVSPSGCVRDESWRAAPPTQQKGSFLHSEHSANNIDAGRSPERSRLVSPLDKSVDTDSLDHDNTATPQDRTYETKDDSVSGTSVYIGAASHIYLVADAAAHAIWAVEVITETLVVRTVPPCCYMGHSASGSRGGGGNHSVQGGTQTSDSCMTNPMPVLGGSKGFVDGTFEFARFNSPSSLCWGADLSGSGKDGTRGCTVLFVSDVGNHAIRQVDFAQSLVCTIVGTEGVPGYRDGACSVSRLQRASVLVWASVGLLFVDEPNHAARVVVKVDKLKSDNSAKVMKRPPPLNFTATLADSHAELASEKQDECAEGSQLGRGNVQVFTVVDEPHSGLGTQMEGGDLRCCSMGVATAAVVTPDGGGVLFVDGHRRTLQVLLSGGVKTLVSPIQYANRPEIPLGLVGCSHLVACSLILNPNDPPCTAFLASSRSSQTVSLLVLRGGLGDGAAPGSELHLSLHTLLLPASTAELQGGVLKMHRRVEKRAAEDCQDNKISISKSSAAGVVSGGDATPMATATGTWCTRMLFRKTSLGTNMLAARTERVAELVMDVYLYYARRPAPHHKGVVFCPPNCKHHIRHTGRTHSLSLLSFWRIITHAGYFATWPLPPFCTLFPPHDGKLVTTHLTGRAKSALTYLNVYDWRVVIAFLHEWSVRRHGHHIVSLMRADYFSRALVLLYYWRKSWCEQQLQESKVDEKGVFSPRWLADDALDDRDDEEVLGALEDFVDRIKEARELLQGTMKEPNEKDNQQCETGMRKGEEGVKLLGDDVLQLLIINEGPLRELFDTYGKKTFVTRCSAVPCGTSKRPFLAMLRLRQALNTDQECDSVPMDHVVGMPYNDFRRLFFAMGVFPTLITEPLLQRAFVDAVTTPLFRSVQMEAPVIEIVERRDGETKEQGEGKPRKMKCKKAARPYAQQQHHKMQRYIRRTAELSFLLFVEAFARVALTIFSLCPDHDKRVYPTAAAKVGALMRWVNRSIELHHTREREVPCHIGTYRGAATQASFSTWQTRRQLPVFVVTTTSESRG